MGDIKNSADPGEENVNDQEQEEENGSDDNKKEEETTEKNEEEQGGEDDEKKSSSENDNENDEEDNDDKDPPIRASKQTNWKNKYFAEKRIANKKQDKNEDENDENEDDIAPEDEDMVSKVIRKQFGNKFDQMDTQADKLELKEFISDNPDFKPYQAKILKFLQHPSRNHLPIETVALEAVGLKNLIRVGAKIGKKADDRARKESGGGHSSSETIGGKKVADMTDAEIDAKTEEVLRSGNR